MSANTEQIESEEDEEEHKKTAQNGFSWERFAKRILFAKRIWRYWFMFLLVYYGSRRIFRPWYSSHVQIESKLRFDEDAMMIENVIGLNAHKPATNATMLSQQLLQAYLAFKSRNVPLSQVLDECKTRQPMTRTATHMADIHIAIWSFCLFIDTVYFLRRKDIAMNKNDKVMYFHHIFGLICSSILKYQNANGSFWLFISFWSEGIGTFMMIGSLLRVYYQKKRPDLNLVRYISDAMFFVGAASFTYARTYLFTKYVMAWMCTYCRSEQYSVASRVWCSLWPLMLMLGYWWSFETWRVLAEKIVDELRQRKLS